MTSTKNNSSDVEDVYDARFQTLDIRYPVCRVFTPRKENSTLCECNRPQKRHPQFERGKKSKSVFPTLVSRPVAKQDRIVNEKANAHGRLISGAWYARFHPEETPLSSVQNILSKVWKLPQPKLILSIVGGTKYFTLNQRLEAHLTNGIINLGTRSDIWVITNGYSSGLVQLVSQAVYKVKFREAEKKTIALGICKWGSIRKPEKIIRPKKSERTPANENKLDISESSTDDDDHLTQTKPKLDRDIDIHHTHYLMLDDGTYGNKDTGDFRTRLCQHLTREYDETVPTVTIVVEGDDSTITHIYNDLRANIPVVIIDGSGRVADFFSRWWIYTKDLRHSDELRHTIFEIDELNANDEPSIISNATVHTRDKQKSSGLKVHEVFVDLKKPRLSAEFAKYRDQLREDLRGVLYADETQEDLLANLEDQLTNACQKVMYCLQPKVRSNITIYNLNSDTDLPETIFRSITQSYQNIAKKKEGETPSNSDTLLALAMDWNYVDVAKEFVFGDSFAAISDINHFFIKALQSNLFTFVAEFINLGLDPADVFFPGNSFMKRKQRYDHFIQVLYAGDVIDMGKTELKVILAEDSAFKSKSISSTYDLNTLLRALIGDYMHKLYYDSHEKEFTARYARGLVLKRKQKGPTTNPDDLENLISSTDAENRELAHDYILRDLFLWSILMNYIDMGKVFLSSMKYRMCPALIATKILKEYYARAPYGAMKDQYKENATYFEKYAIDCLDKCDDHDVNKACQIILQSNHLYGYVTCVQVAADAHDEKFLGEPCCDEALTNVWFDKIDPKQTEKLDFVKFIVALVTLGLTAPLLTFRRRVRGAETSRKKLRTCGINYSDPYPLEYPPFSTKHINLNRYVHQVHNFHQSPLIKFCYHFIVYLFFLLLFSYVLLFQFNIPTDDVPSIHWTEILTIILVTCMTVEEIRYFVSQDSLTLPGKFKHYYRDIFKWMIVIALGLFYIGLIVRFTRIQSEEDFIAARVIMAIDVELWWLGFLSFIIVIPFLGPHLVSIQKMLRDLGFFILVILIVMIGYGVTTRSMYFYQPENNLTIADGGDIDPSFDGRSVFGQILYPVYYFLHGEYDSELAGLDQNPNAGGAIASYVLFAAQMLFVNILLTNLLIAMFSKRFEEVYEDTRNIWLYQKFLFTREYYIRSPFFPPFSVFYDFFYITRRFYFFLRTCCNKSADHHRRVFKMISKEKDVIKDWHQFENAATYEYAQNQVKAAKLNLAKLPSGQETSEEKKSTQKGASNTLESLRMIQGDMAKLNASIEGMKGDLLNRPSTP